MTTLTKTTDGRLQRIAFLVLRILLAAMFIAAAAAKLAGVQAMVDEFEVIGLGQWFRYLTAIIEIAGGVLLLVPRTVTVGALILGLVCVGAFFAQLLRLHGDVIHTIVLAAIFGAIVWYRRKGLMR